MAKKEFDNSIKVFHSRFASAAGAVSGVTIDLDVPRGYLAKIRKIISTAQVKTDNSAGQGLYITMDQVLLRDPDDDDTVITEISQEKDSDLLYAHSSSFIRGITPVDGAHIAYANSSQIADFSELEDLVVVRPMRHNAEATNVNADLMNYQFDMTLYYTWEKVTDETMLALLDLL